MGSRWEAIGLTKQEERTGTFKQAALEVSSAFSDGLKLRKKPWEHSGDTAKPKKMKTSLSLQWLKHASKQWNDDVWDDTSFPSGLRDYLSKCHIQMHYLQSKTNLLSAIVNLKVCMLAEFPTITLCSQP